MNLQLNLTEETKKMLDDVPSSAFEDGPLENSKLASGIQSIDSSQVAAPVANQLPGNRKCSFILQKVTKFEGIIIEKVFFSNKNIYGNLMLSTCKQVEAQKSPPPEPSATGMAADISDNEADRSLHMD